MRVSRADGANQHSREPRLLALPRSRAAARSGPGARPPSRSAPRAPSPAAQSSSGLDRAAGDGGCGPQRQKDRMICWKPLEDPDPDGTSRSICPAEAAGASSVPPARVMS